MAEAMILKALNMVAKATKNVPGREHQVEEAIEVGQLLLDEGYGPDVITAGLLAHGAPGRLLSIDLAREFDVMVASLVATVTIHPGADWDHHVATVIAAGQPARSIKRASLIVSLRNVSPHQAGLKRTYALALTQIEEAQ